MAGQESIIGRKDRDSQRSSETKSGILLVLTNAVIAAKTPMLMAKATPNFSFGFIWSFQMSGQGRNASVRSMAPEYATMHCQQDRIQDERRRPFQLAASTHRQRKCHIY